MRKLSRVLVPIGLGLLIATPALAQRKAWQDKWYWGAQGGVFAFETPTQPTFTTAVGVGGHWFITGSRGALQVAVHEIFFETGTTSTVPNPSSTAGFSTVGFDHGRLYQASLYAIPTDVFLQPYAGIGFAINHITNAVPQGPFATAAEQNAAFSAVAERDTKAFVVFSGGFQWRVGRLAAFGQYQYTPAGRDFLISSETHNFMGGLRFALTSSHEAVSTQQ